MKIRLSLVACVAVICACASSRVSQTIAKKYSGPPVRVIALDPSAGVLGEAIGIELFNKNYNVVDAGETEKIAGRYNLSEFQISEPVGLDVLRERGVDALLIVKSVAGEDSKPQSAIAKLVSTHTQEVIAAISWQNGWGGQAGSILDRSKRKDVTGAAQEMTAALIKNFQ